MITGNQAIVCILTGVAMTAVGILNKTFYRAKGILGAASSDKKMPAWAGRLIFLVVGGAFLAI